MKKSIVSIACGLLLGSLAFARHPKIAVDLDQADADSNLIVIVQYRAAMGEDHHSRVHRQGGNLRSRLEVVNGAAYSVPAARLEDLASDPDVAFIFTGQACPCASRQRRRRRERGRGVAIR